MSRSSPAIRQIYERFLKQGKKPRKALRLARTLAEIQKTKNLSRLLTSSEAQEIAKLWKE